MAKANAPRRLDPAQRREQLLDSAVTLIVERGLSTCSLEEVAIKAGVSKALVYKFFQTRDELLKALVSREYEILRATGDFTQPELSFAEALSEANRRTFDYLNERGAILREIFSDRVTGQALGRGDRDERARRTRYFADKVAQTYGLSPKVALMGTLIVSNLPGVSATTVQRNGYQAKEAADFFTAFVLGGWAAVSARYGDKPSG